MARIALIPGDGIGVDVTRQAEKALKVLAAAGLPIELTHWDLGADRYLRTGTAITEEEFAELAAYDALFLGAMGDPRVADNAHARAILLGLRFRFDLYINLRPVKLIDPRLSPLKDVRPGDVDIVIFRENTEGIYLGLGGQFKKGTPDEVAIEEDLNTRKGVERIIRAAFEYARAQKRRKVTLTDKANAMQHAGGLWRRVFAEVGNEFKDVPRDAVYIDALAFDLIRRPAHYDVIVAPNLFGDILSDLVAALVGGLGLAPSANLHPAAQVFSSRCTGQHLTWWAPARRIRRGASHHGAHAPAARPRRMGCQGGKRGQRSSCPGQNDGRPGRFTQHRCGRRLGLRAAGLTAGP
jgi:3-isopropylmalate dehydrogenase